MATVIPIPTIVMRRLLPAVLAAAGMLVGSAVARPGTADAKPEWDIEYYDTCMDIVRGGYMAGEYTTAEMGDLVSLCCDKSGGVNDGGGDCSAPPAVAVSDTPSAPPPENANPDVPAEPPPTKAPRTTLTLAPIAPIAPVG